MTNQYIYEVVHKCQRISLAIFSELKRPNQIQNVPDALQYVPTSTIVLILPLNLTVNKEFFLGMPYQLMEDNRSTEVKLLSV